MKILVVNCGSSSLKFQLINMENNEVLASGRCDRIGGAGINAPFIEYKKGNGPKQRDEVELRNHTHAFETVVKYLTDPEKGVIKDLSEINGIGHRIVNGGPKFTGTVLVTPEVLEEYNTAIEYAPLHNPAHLQGINAPFIEYKKGNGPKTRDEVELRDHTQAFETVIKYLTDTEKGVIKDLSEINGIGHRIVNGGPKFTHTVLVTDEVLEEYNKALEYAPLHNPAHLQGINACTKTMPNVPQALVFDTAFHTTIPEKAALYAIPYEYYEKYGIKRYGAHGTSHKFITEAAAKVLGKNKEELNIISCHLGNGASVAAIKNGKCIDTSMGLTPLEGLIMGTRCGDLDPAVLEFVMRKENLSISEMMEILNKKSGLLGVTNVTGDVRDLKELSQKGDARAELALQMFGYRVKKYIGAYMAALGHVDAIIFEGGIGEHNPDVVNRCVEGLEEWYDKTYESILTTIILSDYLETSKDIDQLKRAKK